MRSVIFLTGFYCFSSVCLKLTGGILKQFFWPLIYAIVFENYYFVGIEQISVKKLALLLIFCLRVFVPPFLLKIKYQTIFFSQKLKKMKNWHWKYWKRQKNLATRLRLKSTTSWWMLKNTKKLLHPLRRIKACLLTVLIYLSLFFLACFKNFVRFMIYRSISLCLLHWLLITSVIRRIHFLTPPTSIVYPRGLYSHHTIILSYLTNQNNFLFVYESC